MIDLDRIVNAGALVSLAGTCLQVGYPLAGHRRAGRRPISGIMQVIAVKSIMMLVGRCGKESVEQVGAVGLGEFADA